MNLVERLIQADRKSPKRILVVGDIMDDVYVSVRVEDNCQEGCQKFVETDRVVVPGGAANAANSLCHWRSNVLIPYRGLHYKPTQIPTKTRYMVGGKCVLRSDNDSLRHSSNLDYLHYELIKTIDKYSAVLISDYDKGTLKPRFISELATACRRYAIPCVADCKRPPETYDGCILKANGTWGVRNGIGWKPEEAYIETHGEDYPGVWYLGRWRSIRIPNLPPVKCVNHVGAGDCFAAHLTLALAHGFSLWDAAAIAHSAGRVYVRYPHNRPPQPEEIAVDMASATCAAV